MPLWTVHHTTGTYSAQDKLDFSRHITGFYTRIGLPKFYVVVVFEEHAADSFFVGGEPAVDTVRFVIEHIAVHSDGPEQQLGLSRRIAELVAPFTSERGLYSEFHLDETSRELWMVQGLVPPKFGSEEEAEWSRQNRPVPRTTSDQAWRPGSPLAGVDDVNITPQD